MYISFGGLKHLGVGIGTVLLFSSAAAVYSAMVIALWAIPIHFLLMRLNKAAYGWYAFTALIPSIVFSVIYSQWAVTSILDIFIFCCITGAIGSTVFWYCAVYKKHNKAV